MLVIPWNGIADDKLKVISLIICKNGITVFWLNFENKISTVSAMDSQFAFW